jgi:hypothetical protein
MSTPPQGPAGPPPQGTPSNWIDPSGWWWDGELWHPPGMPQSPPEMASTLFVPPPALKHSRQARDFSIGLAVVVGVGIAIYAGIPSSPKESLPPVSSAADGSGSAPADPVPTDTSSPSVTSGIVAWVGGGGLTKMDAVTAALGQVHDSSNDAAATGVACGGLASAVSDAQAYEPIPLPAVQSHWSAALNDFANAASDCVSGVSGNDVVKLSASASELGLGSAELKQATSAISGAS